MGVQGWGHARGNTRPGASTTTRRSTATSRNAATSRSASNLTGWQLGQGTTPMVPMPWHSQSGVGRRWRSGRPRPRGLLADTGMARYHTNVSFNHKGHHKLIWKQAWIWGGGTATIVG